MTQLDAFLGALFIGCTIATALWGVTCVQTWTYFTTPQGIKGDSRWIQGIVIALWLFDTAHQIHTTSTVYNYCVTSFGNFEALSILPRAAWLQAFFIQLVALLVHGIYIWKIWRLSKHNWLLITPLIILKIAQIVSAIIDIKLVSEDYTFEDLFRTTHLWTTEINAFDFTVDVVIATFMYYLLSHNDSEYQRTRSMIKRIMIFTLSTNMITSLCALVILITAVIMPRNAIFLAFLFVKSRLYVNSLMASLNFRPYLLKGGRVASTVDVESAANVESSRINWRRSQGPQAYPLKQQDPNPLEMSSFKQSGSLDASGHTNLNVMVHIDKHHD